MSMLRDTRFFVQLVHSHRPLWCNGRVVPSCLRHGLFDLFYETEHTPGIVWNVHIWPFKVLQVDNLPRLSFGVTSMGQLKDALDCFSAVVLMMVSIAALTSCGM